MLTKDKSAKRSKANTLFTMKFNKASIKTEKAIAALRNKA